MCENTQQAQVVMLYAYESLQPRSTRRELCCISVTVAHCLYTEVITTEAGDICALWFARSYFGASTLRFPLKEEGIECV